MERRLNRVTCTRQTILGLALVSLISIALLACGDDDGGGDGGDHATGAGSVGDIEVEGAYARESVNDVAVVYMTIKNKGAEDTLVSASADVGSEAQLHEVAGTAMRPIDGGIVIPEGGEVMLQTGGMHVMILGLEDGLKADGSHIHVTLTFERAGEVVISVPIQSLDGEDDPDHEGDDHSDENQGSSAVTSRELWGSR
jgi:hypothetical protein